MVHMFPSEKPNPSAVMSQLDLARLGTGEVAYIKTLSSNEARHIYPGVDELPADIAVFALHGADGTPLALTDTIQAAVGHAMGDELAIAGLH